MINLLKNSIFTVSLILLTQVAYSQFKLPYGKVTLDELSSKVYKPDPGADAVILSKTTVASIQYEEGFYIEQEFNTRIKIINRRGFDYADIEIPYSTDDYLDNIKATTYNLKNGEKVETQVPKESFITEHTSKWSNTLKFNFPDVHEGSVVEYSYKMRLNASNLNSLVPWYFQDLIPVDRSTITVVFPQTFIYKTRIFGSSSDVYSDFSTTSSNFFGEGIDANIWTYTASEVPAFRPEPYILSKRENMTRITFEISKVDFPRITYNDISPSYERLNAKLLDLEDFGTAIQTNFKSVTEKVTAGLTDDLSKLKKIHKYIAEKIMWDGYVGIRASDPLKTIVRKEKGSSADINMTLIAMLRSAGLKADPVILSTRSHGSLNISSAMMKQFNYVVAAVQIGDKRYLVDATDPLRPFDMLPFACLNGSGRLISLTESAFVDLKNNEISGTSKTMNLVLSPDGSLTGDMEYKVLGLNAYTNRYLAKMEGEEGFREKFLSDNPAVEISDIRIEGLKDPYSDLMVKNNVKIHNEAIVNSDRIILSLTGEPFLTKSPFYSAERKFPVDFGYPQSDKVTVRIKLPAGYSVALKPADVTADLSNNGGKFEFTCTIEDDALVINNSYKIEKTIFQPSEYQELRDFYKKILGTSNEIIVLKKNSVTR